MKIGLPLAFNALFVATPGLAHGDHCAAVTASVAEAGFADRYLFETRTVTNRGEVKRAELCR